MVDATFLIQTAIGVAILAAIALIGSNFSTIVSFFSGEWARTIEKARRQKAAREQLYGYATVNNYEDAAPVVMSRWEDDAALSSPSSLQTDGAQTDRQPTQAQPGRAELLTLYKVMRESGMSREKARPALKAVGLPLDNNLWAEAVPPNAPVDSAAAYVTPIVGRATNAKFEATDPDYPFEPCRS